MNKFYFTTPLYYPNARLHAGHAYTTLVCDAFARYKRLCGYDVAFLTGTDEHGEKLERAATAAGQTPQAFVAEKRAEIQKLWKLLDISYTHFVYTDRPDHTVSVQRLLRLAQENDLDREDPDKRTIYKRRYEGRYCIFDELYISEGPEPANCPVCGRPGELISEENYFFRLSKFEKSLLDLYEKNPEFVRPDFRLNEVKSFVKSGLRDISISRKRIKWGVPWPDDPEQVFYVWYDALTGYLTGIDYATDGEDAGKRERQEGFWKWWPADFHMVGKDIIRFHAVYWPAFLMAARLPLPKSIVAHGWLLVEGDKMSKSKGNAVYPEPLAALFDSETHGVVAGSDVLRYYVLRDIPFGHDGTISYEGLIQRYNSDLANDLGNLANRVLSMIGRYFDGNVPAVEDASLGEGRIEILEYIPSRALETRNEFSKNFDSYDFSRALDEVWVFVKRINSFLVVMAPWSLAQTEFDASKPLLKATLYTAAEAVRFCSVLLYPVIPRSAERLWKQLGCEGNVDDQRLDQLQWGGLNPGTKVGKPEPIFPRLDKEAALEKLLKLEAAEQTPATPEEKCKPVKEGKVESQPEPPEPKPPAPAVPQTAPAASPVPTDQKISIDDFAKVEMRVGEIISAEPIPKATKLLKLQVDIGTEIRQVLAGIAEHYQPEQLVGMKVVVVTNLQPRKMRGLESNGMIVAASVGDEGKPVLVTFKEDVPKGARLK
ncbi:MAG TPA: methionine--tRNA ligase [Terriglobia bacterium]|nr:methionine--tRNA ligase [Terriglobia bacterium]